MKNKTYKRVKEDRGKDSTSTITGTLVISGHEQEDGGVHKRLRKDCKDLASNSRLITGNELELTNNKHYPQLLALIKIY